MYSSCNVLPCTKHSITTWFIDCSYTRTMLPSYVKVDHSIQLALALTRCSQVQAHMHLFISPCSKVPCNSSHPLGTLHFDPTTNHMFTHHWLYTTCSLAHLDSFHQPLCMYMNFVRFAKQRNYKMH